MTNSQTNYDLEERTTQFSGKLIIFLKKIPQTSIFIPLVNQCLRSGTSIGANYREANGASSRKDFFNKIFICKKEAKETLYWLEIIEKALDDDNLRLDCHDLHSETKEFILIFGKIVSNSKV
ncbi:MAG: four helix bundle protein [Patescibacteria group bacterium]|mgnify:FL=1